MDNSLTGLTTAQVQERQREIDPASLDTGITKSRSQIVKENLCTLFNFLNFGIAILLFAVGAYTNMVFIAIILLNIVIGVSQEFKAKELVDELSILNRPTVRVIRDGKEQTVSIGEVVRDDLTVLESGSQICNDAVVASGTLEVNESLLTGESDAIIKEPGAELYSGSSVISGKAYARVIHTGNENYATKLANEVKKEKQVNSELLGSMRKVTHFTSFLIVPLGVILFLEAFFLRHAPIDEAVINSSAALLGMLPKGLVLLISISLAAGVIRLARMKILVQNIYSLETLAHVDVLCLDKTGTITDGKLTVHSVIPIANDVTANTERMLRSYLAASDDNNATFQALSQYFLPKAYYLPSHKIAFSSLRKWGCISFGRDGSLFVGAPDILLPSVPAEMEQELENGRRLIVAAYCREDWRDSDRLPADLTPVSGIVLEDTIRKKTKETLRFFREEGVQVKVISGDHIKTVSMIAKRAGLEDWDRAIDLSAAGEDIDFDAICEEYSVFARVTPKHKQALVKAMQRRGHQVAMTGDGVNDLLALREADCSIAVADGSDASRQLAQVVLLDSDFSNLPQIVMEGRQVIHNVTRTAAVFFIKTIYSVLVSILCLIGNIPFPFIPIQITLIDACIEGYPSFLTIFEKDTRQIRGKFLNTALANAAPFALVVTGMIAVITATSPFADTQRQTVMYALLIFISMMAVFKSCHPFNPLRTFICITMAIGTPFALWLLPSLFEVTAITRSMAQYLATAACLCLCALLLIEGIRELLEKRRTQAASEKH